MTMALPTLSSVLSWILRIATKCFAGKHFLVRENISFGNPPQAVHTKGGNKTEVNAMPNQPKPMQDPAMKQYFDTLPTSVQETIIQSGMEVNSLEQLKQCAEHFMQKKG